MRVLQFVADGRPGGGTSVVLDLCLGLRARHGIESIVASAPDSYALATASAAGLAARPLDLWRSRLDRSAPVRLRRLIDEVRPDLVHAHGGRAGLAIARASGPVPFVYTVHGYHFATKPWPQRLAGALAERVTGSRAAAIVWVCA
ncbi:glycosyltransferase family 4 protein, partial [Geminicoccus harenae]